MKPEYRFEIAAGEPEFFRLVRRAATGEAAYFSV
jgi:hypothetical protein